MTWTMFTPFVPYVRALLLIIAAALFIDVVWRTHRASQQGNSAGQQDDEAAPSEESVAENALRQHRGKMIVATLSIVLAILISTSSAYRPKDRIQADYSDRDTHLEQVDAAEDRASPDDLKGVGPKSVDWEAARSKFRSQVEEEEDQFERATSKD